MEICSRLVGASVLVLGALIVVGCGGGGGAHPVAPVQGVVELDGQPVPGVVVTFNPELGPDGETGKSASGISDENGRFRLSTYDIGDGAIVGTHKVTIGMDGPDPTPPGTLADDTREVTPGKNDFTIELQP